MAFASVNYTGNGATVLFTIPFPYIAEPHIFVSVNGVDKTVTTDYTFLNASTISFNVAPANGATVGIRRVTPKVTRIVNFQDAAILTETALDQDADQLLYIAQEGFDVAEGSLRLATDNTFDALSKRIKNVADPVNPQDAATRAYVDATTPASAAAAAASAAAASGSATAASGSATAAAGSATAASGSATAAAASAAEAAGYVTLIVPANFQAVNAHLTNYIGGVIDLELTNTSTAAIQVAKGTTAQRPAGVDGKLRYNSDLQSFEGYSAGAWGSIGGGAKGGVGNSVFYENDQTVSVDYTITSGKNAVSAGPITINTGVTVTVPTGSTWSIV